ncbi:hypothetical protein B0T17DRAFT_510664 [Bombardia bombarda]|uniref:Uncharacterized protein n=1 Tax=Bombardia bombarda TaxID=252184 RepID=A0AA39WIR9_9PEZI|nr:hypothetical protein B0T17DRAFT_510664 [Bombardia bombarda]
MLWSLKGDSAFLRIMFRCGDGLYCEYLMQNGKPSVPNASRDTLPDKHIGTYPHAMNERQFRTSIEVCRVRGQLNLESAAGEGQAGGAMRTGGRMREVAVAMGRTSRPGRCSICVYRGGGKGYGSWWGVRGAEGERDPRAAGAVCLFDVRD